MLTGRDLEELNLKKKNLINILMDCNKTMSNHIQYIKELNASKEKKDYLLANILGSGSIKDQSNIMYNEIDSSVKDLDNQINRFERIAYVTLSQKENIFIMVDQGIEIIQKQYETFKKFLELAISKSKNLLENKLNKLDQ